MVKIWVATVWDKWSKGAWFYCISLCCWSW